MTAFETNFYFALVGLPLSYYVVQHNGDIEQLHDIFMNPETKDSALATFILISGCCGILITIFSTLTVTVCGPIAINIAGTLKDVGLTYAGFVFFEAEATRNTLIGIGLSFTGASYMVI